MKQRGFYRNQVSCNTLLMMSACLFYEIMQTSIWGQACHDCRASQVPNLAAFACTSRRIDRSDSVAATTSLSDKIGQQKFTVMLTSGNDASDSSSKLHCNGPGCCWTAVRCCAAWWTNIDVCRSQQCYTMLMMLLCMLCQSSCTATTNCRAYYSIVLITQLAVQVRAIALALTWLLAWD